ncbi:glycosyltransferase family 4 protein [Patescibacteria group bacterium]
MRILYVLNSGQPGGMEQHVLDLIEGMKKLGHEVFVWCPQGPMFKKYADAEAKVTEKEIKWDIDFKYIFQLKKFLKENKIEIVHSHELKAVTNATLAGFLARTKVKISHTHTPITEWQINPIKKFINMLAYAPLVDIFSTKEIALTESRKKTKRKEGICKRKLVVIPNGVDVDEFCFSDEAREGFRSYILRRYDIPQNSYIFGVVGRISKEKGHSVLLEAFSKVEGAYLLIAGGGPLEEEIKRDARNLGISDKVIVTGRFPAIDHKKYFAAINCFVHPSLAEGFGIVLTEAMAAKIPIIASDLEVLQEVGGDTISYFKTGDSVELAQKMKEILEGEVAYDPDPACKRVRERYSLDFFIKQYENLYHTLLE